MKRAISVLLIFSLLFTFASCNNKKVDINATTINNTTSNIETTTSIDKPAADDGTNISTILNSDPYIHCLDFSNGYAYVLNYDATYIIDTNGYICAEIPVASTYGKFINEGYKLPFYEGVSIVKNGSSAISIDTSGNVINTWEDCSVLAISEENLLFVIEYEQTIDGKIERCGTQNYKGEWLVGPFEVDYSYRFRGNNFNYEGHDIVSLENGYTYYNLKTGEVYRKWKDVPIESDVLYFNEILPDNYATGKTKIGYWNNDKLVVDLYGKNVIQAFDFVDGIGAFSSHNGSGAYYLSAIDETGKNVFEPIRISSAQANNLVTFSEGYLPIWIYNDETNCIDRIDYIDMKGNVAFSIPGSTATTSFTGLYSSFGRIETYVTASVNNGIVTNGLHYYNTKGELLF